MGKRQSKEKRKDCPSSKRNAKESETCLPVQEKGNQDKTMSSDDETMSSLLCCKWTCLSKSKYSFQAGKSMPPDEKESSSVRLNSSTSIELKGLELTNINNEELTILQTEVDKLKTVHKMQLTDIDIKKETFLALETELANLKVAFDTECQTRRKLEEYLNDRNNEINEMDNQLKKLKEERGLLEEEKQGALLRLGNLMYATLYDNNPAIADLSDQNRPTRLAEQFSRLYDYQWTNAYAAFQKHNFTERESVEKLLDLVMESNEFCVRKLDETWAFVKQWFLVTDSSSVETIKALKDGRKQKLMDNVPQIQEKFYEHVCERYQDLKLTEVINLTQLKVYINECVRLCLMMNACDPPVIMEIPGWKPLIDRPAKFSLDDNEQSRTHQQFDQTTFREYTCRGKYVDYFVWPVVYLYRNGAVLSRGIAQGIKVQKSNP